MRKKDRSGIVFLIDQLTLAMDLLSEAELGLMVTALCAYAANGQLPEMLTERKEWRVIFKMMRSSQDDAIARYEETCERNRQNANKRWREQLMRSHAMDANIIKTNQKKENKAYACGGAPVLYGQEGVTKEDVDDDGYWM